MLEVSQSTGNVEYLGRVFRRDIFRRKRLSGLGGEQRRYGKTRVACLGFSSHLHSHSHFRFMDTRSRYLQVGIDLNNTSKKSCILFYVHLKLNSQ